MKIVNHIGTILYGSYKYAPEAIFIFESDFEGMYIIAIKASFQQYIYDFTATQYLKTNSDNDYRELLKYDVLVHKYDFDIEAGIDVKHEYIHLLLINYFRERNLELILE